MIEEKVVKMGYGLTWNIEEIPWKIYLIRLFIGWKLWSTFRLKENILNKMDMVPVPTVKAIL